MLTRAKLERLRRTPLAEGERNKLAAARSLAGVGVTQTNLSDAIGCSQTFISKLETGDYVDVHVEMARKLSEFFGCDIEDLFPSREQVTR